MKKLGDPLFLSKTILFLNILILAITSWLLFGHQHQKSKVAFIRSSDVLANYKGVKEANALISTKYGEWQANLAKLEQEWQNKQDSIHRFASILPVALQRRLREEIEVSKSNYEKYATYVKDISKVEQDKILQQALDQINATIKVYAEEKDYELVIGVLSSGNVLYGADKIDITDEIISRLNNGKP